MRAPKDFWTGAIYLVIGVVGFFVARNYSFGSTTRMGPGYFPTVLAGLLTLVGLISLVRAFVVEGAPVGALALRPLASVVGAIVVFGLAVVPLGGAVAMLLTILVAATASRQFKLAPLPLLGASGLVAICCLVFIEMLNVPMPLVGPWLRPLLPNF
ncbi:tripartite tricarboxylate transporter TctB family protein [Ancylobacter aquaticus]|uniref:Tripartite tricarboxylate transporter TctB family protein n=1 Tax=Ancylobacter aquaticus TaxID=100 RepID=A0A4R1H4H4_ANCAQ|nr:tripartite tricarboxylate transporter TctB family protein [Ancylobacter aquaticus]TCK16584.1 tripartite tricarboxylate transporter TctB family protein [Ancylobacter aquaticus]